MKYTLSAYADKLIQHIHDTTKEWPNMHGKFHVVLDQRWQLDMIQQRGSDFHDILAGSAHKAIHQHYFDLIVQQKPDETLTAKQQKVTIAMHSRHTTLETLIYKIPITFSIHKRILKLQQISELTSNDIDKFVALKVSIVGAGDRLAKLIRFSAQDEDGLEQYYEPADFKAEKKYKFLKKEYEYVQYLTVEESSHHKKTIQTYKLAVRLPDSIVGKITETKKYIITGFYRVDDAEAEAGKQEQNLYLDCISVASIATPKTRTLSQSEITKYKEMASTEPEKYLKMLTDSYAPHIYQNEIGKLGLMLGYLKAVSIGHYRSEIFTCLIGSPGGGKSEILRFMEKILDDFIYIDSQGASTRGLLFSQSEWKKQKILHRGILLKYENVAIDEFDKFWKSQQKDLNTVIEQRITTYNKSPFNEVAEVTCNIAIGANPKNSRWIKEKGIMKNLESIGTTIVDRGLIIRISANTDIKNKLGHIFANILDKDQLITPLSTDKLSALYSYASSQKPKLDGAAADTITKFLIGFAQIEQSTEQDLPIETRKELDLIRLSIKMAQILLKDRVDDTAVRLAIEFYKDCLATVGMNTEKPTTTSRLETWEGKSTDIFWVLFKELAKKSDKEQVSISELKEEMGKTEKWQSVEHINMYLAMLEKKATIFEPTPGVYQTG